MLDYYALLILTVSITGVISLKKKPEYQIPGKMNLLPLGKVIFVLLFAVLVLFQATRTTYNDTTTYTQLFYQTNPQDSIFKKIFEPYGGFDVLFILTRRITSNINVFFLFIAVFVNFVYLRIIFKYSKSISQSLLIFLTDFFLFSMAGLKQSIAIAFVLIAIELYLSNKKLLSLIPIALGYLFHPYIIIILVVPLLTKKTFSIRMFVVVTIIILAFLNLDLVFDFFSIIGKDYSLETTTEYTINPLRIIVEFIPIAIMIFGRKKIENKNDKLLVLGVNMCFIAWVFHVIGLFIEPIYPGRISIYFNILYPIIMPTVLGEAFSNFKKKNLIILFFYILMFAYFMLDFTKLGQYPLNYDRFNHNSIVNLFYW